MRKVMVLLFMLLACLLAIFPAAAQDEAEDGIEFQMPTVENGEPYEGTFETTTMQLFLQPGTAGDIVTISMEQEEGSALDPFLILIGPDGQVVAYNDDSESLDDLSFAAQIVEAELPVDGLYFLMATTFGEVREATVTVEAPMETPEDYTLSVEGFTPSEERQTFTFNYFEPEDGVISITGTLALTVEMPVFIVGFPVAEGETISFSTSAAEDSTSQLSDPLVYVFDSTGARIAGADDTEGLFPVVEVPASSEGVHLIFITAYSFWTANEEGEDYTGIGDFFAELNVD